ncbi:serine/arginine-rich splicing factor 10-like [Dysidea avara]|uniref:serine/arginine-rich splicing factor 10-like n=1 Tax=Dysidea avara TaxID=196820 RepID=UPI003333E414
MSSKRRSSSATSLFVRGLNLRTKAEELRDLFSQYGSISDVYVPLDYYTREPRGFAYIQYDDGRDAEDALHYLDGYRLHGRELEVQYAEGDRKTAGQMRRKERRSSRSMSRSPQRRRDSGSRRYRSRSPRRRRSRSYSRSYSRSWSRSPRRSRSYSRSPSPYHRRR